MSGIPVFFVESTGREFYRRGYECPNKHRQWRPARAMTIGKRSIRCDQCGLMARPTSASTETEYRRPDTGEVFRGHQELPPGAVYEALRWAKRERLDNWRSNLNSKGKPFADPSRCRFLERRHPDDGRVLICVLPDRHAWVIDSRANNCDLPNDDRHWCWNRSGRPEDGTLDVRKGKPGQTTCNAGAGSIQTGSWHGFLHNGQVTEKSLGPTSG